MIQEMFRSRLRLTILLFMSGLVIGGCGSKSPELPEVTSVEIQKPSNDSEFHQSAPPLFNPKPDETLRGPDETLRVGDKFPTFSDEDVRSRSFEIYISSRSNINGNISGTLQLENGQIKLKDGTVYKVLGKCIIDYSKSGVITEGTIEVYHNESFPLNVK